MSGEIGWRCNASLNSISERLGGVCSHLLVSWLLSMVSLVAAGNGSVMRLSTYSCRLILDVRIDGFVLAILSFLKGCLFSAHMR